MKRGRSGTDEGFEGEGLRGKKVEIVEREKGVSRGNGGFDEGYQLVVEMALPVGFLGLASGGDSGGAHGGASSGSLIAAESSGSHGEEGRGTQ